MQIIVVGGGKIGYYLTLDLLQKGHEVAVVDYNREWCEELAKKLSCPVIYGNGADVETLREAGASRANVLAAVTNNDHDNLVSCLLAKREFEVPRTIARTNNPRNEPLFRQLGVDVTVSSTLVISKLIEHELLTDAMRTLLMLKEGHLEIVEIKIPPGAPVVEKSVADFGPHLPKDCLLVAVIRGEQPLIPRGDTVFRAGDTVLAMTSPEQVDTLRQVILGDEE